MGGRQTRAKTGRRRASPLPTACAQTACSPQIMAQVLGMLALLLLTHASIGVMYVDCLTPICLS